MESRTKRLLLSCAACAVILGAACLIGASALNSARYHELIVDSVENSLRAAFGSRVSVQSVSMESFRRVALDGVRYAEAPFDVEVRRVLVDLCFPIVDLVLGRLTPAKFVGRIELVEPVVAWNGRAGQDPPTGLDIETFIDLIASNSMLRELACSVQVSGGQLIASSLPVQSEDMTLDQVSVAAVLDRDGLQSFDMTARWRENGNSHLSITGLVNLDTRAYDMVISASDIRLVDAVPMLYRQSPHLPAAEVFDGAADLALSLQGSQGVNSWVADGSIKRAAFAHRPTGVEVRDVSGRFSATPRDVTLVLTAEALRAEVESVHGSTPIIFGPGALSMAAAVSPDPGAVTARGTAFVESLFVGGVEADDLVCEFRYAAGVLQVSEIVGTLMGGELGGHLSLSLTEEGISGAGQGRLRGVMASKIPIAGISDMIEARLDGTVSLTFNGSDGLDMAGRLRTLMPKVAGLTFDDGTLDFTCKNGLVSIDSLVLGLNGSEIVVKGSPRRGREANLSILDSNRS